MYDPALGRFLSADPIVGNPAFSQSWNAYSYVINSPLNFTDPSGFDPCPAGMYCTTGPGNEIANTIQTPYGNETFGGGTGGRRRRCSAARRQAPSPARFAFVQDMKKLAEQQHAIDVARGRALPDGTKSAPRMGRRFCRAAQQPARAIGSRTTGVTRSAQCHRRQPTSHGETPKNTDGLLTRKAADFAVGSVAEANAPRRARPPAQRSGTIAQAVERRADRRNAVSQALAARALVKFLGKVGVVIDEGVDGIIERLTPDGMGTDDDENKRWSGSLKSAPSAQR